MKLVNFGRPILDVTIRLRLFQCYVSIGGIETNVAINTALLGEESILLGAIGDDILWQKLENLAPRLNKLELSLQRIEDKKSGIIVLLIKENDEVYQKFVDYGASEYFSITSFVQKKISEGEIFFSSLFSANTPALRTQWEEMIRLAKTHSLKIAVSIGGIGTIETNEIPTLLKFIRDSADFIFMNRGEAKMMKTIFTPQSLVVITNEDRSAVAKLGNRKWVIPPERIQITHRPYTIGTGDAFTAGFLVDYFRHGDIEKAMKYGHQIAALKLSVPTSHLVPEIFERR